MARTFRMGTSENGVFGAKLMWNQLPDLEQHATAMPEFAGLDGSELLDRLLGQPGYVWLRRRDKVRQAISLWRALQTRTWRAGHPAAERERPTLAYSFWGIEHLRRRLSADDEGWRRFFLHSLIDPLELVYEDDVSPDPAGAVARVLALVGVALPSDWTPAAGMAQQSDEVNDEWYDAYHRDATARLGV
ncbi:MAG: Stf0 family sulfotransferase [Solirubrobacteraceae bacterium]